MAQSKSHRGGFWLIAFVLLAIAAFGVWVSGIFTPWSPVNCWTESVDINSGRIRTERYLLYRRVSDRTVDSPLTLALDPADLAGLAPEWRRVNTLSPGVGNSPHYAYHGAIGQIRVLGMLWDHAEFTPAARRNTARHMLLLWRRSGSYFEADRSLSDLSNHVWQAVEDGRSVDVDDLPVEWR